MRQQGKFAISIQDMAHKKRRWIIWNLSPESLPIFLTKVKSWCVITAFTLMPTGGKIRKNMASPSHPPIIEQEEPFRPSKGWAEMIRKVYEVDPLLCPTCGGQMKIISFIEDPKSIDKIIAHLKLTFQAERPPPSQIVQQELLVAAEEREEYF
jgi:hypothetical protein